jgi:uncharacterized protein YoxC
MIDALKSDLQTKHQARLEEVATAIVDLDEALAELVREAQPGNRGRERRGVALARGDPTVFFSRPISLAFMVATLAMLVIMITPALRKKR